MMKKSELKEMITKIVKEEINQLVKTELREQVLKQIGIRVPILVKESLEELMPKTTKQSLTEAASEEWNTVTKKPLTTADLTDIRNKIRAATSEQPTSAMNFDETDEFGEVISKTRVPKELQTVFTKDYSSFMKKLNARN